MKQEPALCWTGSDVGINPILHQLQQTSVFCDVTLLDEDGVCLPAHACVLAAGSPVLKNTLMLNQSQTLLRKQGLTLKIAGVHHSIWRTLLQFFYLNEIHVDNDFNFVHNLHKVAKMLGIRTLETLIVEQVEAMAIQIPLVSEIPCVNVTVAPTAAKPYQHRHTQTDVSHLSDMSAQTEAALEAEKKPVVFHVVQDTSDQSMSPATKRLKLVTEEEMNSSEVIQMDTSNFHSYSIAPEPTEVTVETVEDIETIKQNKKTYRKRRKFSCRYCSMLFDRKMALIDHLTELCSKLHGDGTELQESIASYELDHSGTSVIKKERLFEKDYEPGSNYHCFNEDCLMSFMSHSSYMNHLTECLMRDFFHPKTYLVEDGDMLFYRDGAVGANLPIGAFVEPKAYLDKVSANVKLYKCSHCRSIAIKEKMASHLAVVHGKRKPYKCKKCPVEYGYFESLQDHYISQHTAKTFSCEELGCNAVFKKKDSLRRHTLMEHKREGKDIHECGVCHKKFKYSHHARRHERYHLGKEGRRYSCGTCKKAFVTKQDLLRHMDIHSGNKPHKCSQCFYTTARKSNLILHERKHGVVHGDYVCTTCNKYFLIQSRFKAHLEELKHEGCHVKDLPKSMMMYTGNDTDQVVYQTVGGALTTPLTIETVEDEEASKVLMEFDETNEGAAVSMETVNDTTMEYNDNTTTPLTIEGVTNAEGEIQVVPLESITNDSELTQGMAALGANNLVYVVTNGDELVLNVVDAPAVDT